MDVSVYSYQHGDPLLIDKIVNEFLSQGKFDKLRKECMSDADTKPAYQNLQQRVESTVTQFLKKQVWKPDLNKNQLRDSLRKHILESVFFDAGINRIVDQVVNPNVLATVFLPEVEEVVYNYLSIPRPDKNQKKVPVLNAENTEKPSDDDASKSNEKFEKGSKEKSESQDHGMGEMETETKDGVNKVTESLTDDKTKTNEIQKSQIIRTEVKVEVDGVKKNDGSHTPFRGFVEKMEVISDESQESVNQIAVQGIHLNEDERIPVSESDNSVPLYINEKSMSDSRDSEDSIMNQMSPISQGRLTPDLIEEEKVEVKEEKEEKEEIEEKKPLTFIGRIPKLKREDSETSKSSKGKEEVPKREKLDVKHVYSSDESDSSKSLGKSDSDEKKSRDKKRDDDRSQQKDDKKPKDESERKRKHDYHHRDSRDRDKDKDKSKDRRHRDDKSKDRSSKDQKRERSRERHGIKKSSSSSSSSYSREKSSSRHKSSRHESRRRSKEGSHERRRKEHDKRKSKSTDDHGKERNKKEDRRSTDRDSNEGEIDKSTNGRSQEESKKRDKDQKGEESRRDEKSSKEDVQAEKEEEPIPVDGTVVLEMQGGPVSVDGAVVVEMEGDSVPEDGTVVMEVDWISEEGIVVSNLEEGWISSIDVAQETGDQGVPAEVEVSAEKVLYRGGSEVSDVLPNLDYNELVQNGAMSRVEFPKLTDDFYVKFNSTGFKYFEEWEQAKLDCEEEFKDFVDEAENNLDLISDDESDFESGLGVKFDFEMENRKTIRNLLSGWGNFKKSLVFDPAKSEFYKWTNGKFYQKFRRKNEKRRGSLEKNESDESIKENIERRERVSDPSEASKCQKEKNKALHLKLLNKYRRKALWHGKHKRRHRKKKTQSSESWGIKEKNENRNASDMNIKNLRDYEPEKGFLFKSEVMGVSENYSGKSEGVVGFNLVDEEDSDKSGNRKPVLEGSGETKRKDILMSLATGVESPAGNQRVNNLNQGGLGNVENLPESPVDSGVFSESPDSQKRKKGVAEEVVKPKSKAQGLYLKNESLKVDSLIQKCNLPLSPESDDANVKVNGVSSQNLTSRKNKRVLKPTAEDGRKRRKQSRRNNCQKYDSQDLYKPRLLLNSSRMRSREKGLDVDY